MSGLVERMKSWLFMDDDEGAPPVEVEARPGHRRRGAIIALPQRAGRIYIRRPRDQDEARLCVDSLRDRRAVVVNLKEADGATAQRILDFLAGAAYALRGQLEQAGDGVYLAAPQSIGILREEEDEAQAPPESAFWQEI